MIKNFNLMDEYSIYNNRVYNSTTNNYFFVKDDKIMNNLSSNYNNTIYILEYNFTIISNNSSLDILINFDRFNINTTLNILLNNNVIKYENNNNAFNNICSYNNVYFYKKKFNHYKINNNRYNIHVDLKNIDYNLKIILNPSSSDVYSKLLIEKLLIIGSSSKTGIKCLESYKVSYLL